MPEQSPTLRDMIKAAVDSGLTYAQLSKRSIDAETGEKASSAFLNNIVNNNVDRMPYDYHLRAIAAGLRAPYEAVRQAAIAQWVPAESGAPAEPENPLSAAAQEILREQIGIDPNSPRGLVISQNVAKLLSMLEPGTALNDTGNGDADGEDRKIA